MSYFFFFLSLNQNHREKVQGNISHSNMRFANRLENVKPMYAVNEWVSISFKFIFTCSCNDYAGSDFGVLDGRGGDQVDFDSD